MSKKAACLALALAFLLALPGCGVMTPETLAGRVKQAMEKTPCSQTETKVVMEASMADPATGIEMDMGVEMNVHSRMSYDPDTLYEDVELTIEMMGLRIPAEMEAYTFQEGDKVVSYTHMEDSWTRSEIDADTFAARDEFSLSIWDLPAERLAIDKEAAGAQSGSSVCLTATVTGEDVSQALRRFLGSLESGGQLDEDMLIGGAQDSLDDIDWGKLSAQVSAYVDTETWLPLREETVIAGLDEMLADLLGTEDGALRVQNFETTVDYTSYEPAAPCELPPGAREAAERARQRLTGDPDNGDGTFTIQEGSYSAVIRAPEGYELEHSDYDEVDFYSEELDRLVCYQAWTVDGTDDPLSDAILVFLEMVSDEEEVYTGTAFGPGRIEGESIPLDGWMFYLDGYTFQDQYAGANYYAWTCMDESCVGWVLVKIYDGGVTRDSSITRAQLEDLLRRVDLPAAGSAGGGVDL